MFTLQLFGGCTLSSSGAVVTGPPAQRRRLALLALLATSPNGMSRDKLVAYFWPDEDRERARHFLADSLFTLRKSLGKDALLTAGDDLRLNPDVIESDVAHFEELAATGEVIEALELYRGPFLDGFFVADAAEFERWVERERDRITRRVASLMEQVASQHETTGEWATAAEEWRRLAAHDPYSSRVVLRAMRALAKCGDVAGALRLAQSHQARVHEELGLESDPAVVELADSLRTQSATRATAGVPTVERRSVTSSGDSPAQSAPQAEEQTTPATRPTPAPPTPPWTRHLTRRTVRWSALAAVAATVGFILMRSALVGDTVPKGVDSRNSLVALGDVPRADSTDAASRTAAARDLYSQGRYVLTQGQFDPKIHQRALELFERAVERDSTFAPAYAGMADVYNHADDPARAKAAALRAIALDSSLAEAYTALAYVLAFYDYRWADADSALQRAIALNPRYVLAHLRRANVLAAQGRLADAEAEVERARAIQPESFVVMLNRGLMAEMGGRFDEAIGRYQDALTLEPGRKDAQFMLVRAYWAQGKYAEAQGVMRSIGNIGGVVTMSGNPDTMARIAPLLAASPRMDSISLAAAMYVLLGRKADAVAQLEHLYELRHKHLVLTIQRAPFVSLRGYPPFDQLLRKLNVKADSTR